MQNRVIDPPFCEWSSTCLNVWPFVQILYMHTCMYVWYCSNVLKPCRLLYIFGACFEHTWLSEVGTEVTTECSAIGYMYSCVDTVIFLVAASLKI